MAEIRIKQTKRVIECREGENLLEVLLGAGVFVDNPCNGKGICGKCKVRVCSGKVSGMTPSEERLLKPEETAEGKDKKEKEDQAKEPEKPAEAPVAKMDEHGFILPQEHTARGREE